MYVISRVGLTVCAENSAKLRGLVDTAQEWVRAETDRLRQQVMAELNAMTWNVDALFLLVGWLGGVTGDRSDQLHPLSVRRRRCSLQRWSCGFPLGVGLHLFDTVVNPLANVASVDVDVAAAVASRTSRASVFGTASDWHAW